MAETNESVVYSTDPKIVFGKLGGGEGELENPWAACSDRRNGNFHVADHDNKRVSVFDGNGLYMRSYDVDGNPRDLCFTVDGNVAITCSNDSITICDPSGFVKRKIGRAGLMDTFGTFDCLHGITTNNEGMLYVCDKLKFRILILDRSGSAVRVMKTRRRGRLLDPVSVAVHPYTGDVAVVDRERRLVNIYSPSDQYIYSISHNNIPYVDNFRPRSVAFSSDGLMCVSDWYNNCVHTLKDGIHLQQIGKKGTAHGEFEYPYGVSFTHNRDIIACDRSNHRIQIFHRK